MIKATDTKTSSRVTQNEEGSSFFNKESKDAFFTPGGQEQASPSPFFVQAKLTVNQPNDHFEKEADAVADKVVQRLSQPGHEQTVQAKATPAPLTVSTLPAALAKPAAQPESLQKKEESEGKEEEEVVQRKPIFDSMADAPEEKLQRKPIFDSMAAPQEEQLQRKESNAAPATAQDGLQQRLENTKGSGQPLPAETRNAMESSIGADFSGVRVHTGHQATSLSNELGAQAFTHGNNIYFNEGKYDPAANSGQHLLAHELTHTVQQGAAIQKKADLTATPPDDMIQKAPAKGAAPAAASGEVVNIASGTFHASQKLKDSIKAAGKDGMEVNITGGAIAGTGTMKVYEKDGAYESKDQGYLPLKVPLLQAANPMLAVRMKNGQVSGFGTIGKSRDKESIPKWFRNNGNALGWLSGVDVQRMQSQATNEFTGGAFTYRLNNIKVKVGGFADASMDLVVVNGQLGVQVSADMDIKGMAKGNLTITLKDNTLSGEGTFGVNFSTFTGEVAARFMNGALDVKGTVGYEANRLKGSLTLVMTDKATADNLARGQLKAAGNDPAAASLPAEIPAPGDKPGPRALAGMGTLAFQLTEWLTGSVNVIVDGKGDVTVVGEIAPPKEIILFEQKDYTKELFKLEARAAYGLPVIGNVFVFANMALSALAKVGPAKIYDIKLSGTYSTDPDIAQHITLSGALNMSAYAGLRLRAEGGAGLEVLDHDLKVGVGVNADAGVKGYVEARPSITYRDPGEFFFKGHMEIAAQPFLGLSGDLFVEIDSPWWSPLPDKKWTWPIGSLEYPLPGEFGIGADMEYVLGSGKVPEITFSEAKFDGQKFMTDLVDDNVPKKGGGGKGDKQGKYVDGGAAAPPAGPAGGKGGPGAGKGTPGAGKQGAPQTPAPVPGGGKGKDKKGKGDEKIEDTKNFAEAMKAVKSLEQRTKPMTRDEITTAVESIKKRFKVPAISVAPQGTEWWVVTGTVKGMPNKQSVKVKASMKPGDEKEKKGDEKEKQKLLDAGISALKAEDAKVAGDGKMKKEEAEKVAGNITTSHKDTFKSISIKEIDGHWKYHYIQRTEGDVTGAGAVHTLPPGLKIGDTVYLINSKLHAAIESLVEFEGEPRVRVKDLKSNLWIMILLKNFKEGTAYEKVGDPKVLYRIKGSIIWDRTRTKFEYETVLGKKFTGEIDSKDRVKQIKGHKLTLKPPHILGRGTTQDAPGKKKNMGMESSHLIADEFSGSGYKKALNLVATSATYNDPHMRGVEKEIKFLFKQYKAAAMDIEVNVTWGALTDKTVTDAMIADAKKTATPEEVKQLEADIKQQVSKINTKSMDRVISMLYNVTYYDENGKDINTFSKPLGPDIYFES